MRRPVLLATGLSLAGALLAVPSYADDRGAENPRGLSDRELASAASVNGMSSAELAETLASDPSAKLMANQRLVYADPAPEARPEEPIRPERVAPLDQTFELHSLPGSNHTIFLDVDGTTLTASNEWGVPAGFYGPWDAADNGPGFTDGELTAIQDVWARVAEDFAPFDVDVTTEDPGAEALTRSGSGDQTWGTRALITEDDASWNTLCGRGCGGIAYIDVFDGVNVSDYQPAWIWAQSHYDVTKYIAEATTHEVGHNLGLDHDEVNGSGYYEGHGIWAPIMGAGYSYPVVQWSQGGYPGATTGDHQTGGNPDDVAVIAGNGAPYRPDDAGDTVGTSAALPAGSALIGRRTDVDVYQLGTCTGTIQVQGSPAPVSPDLDMELRILDGTGTTLATADAADGFGDGDAATGLGATVSYATNGNPGPYYVRVDGVGQKNDTSPLTGFDDYGSLGAYTLSATGCGGVVTTAPSAPQQLVADVDGTSVDLTWNAPASDGGSPVTGYEVTLDGVVTTTTTTPGATLTGLTPGETYTVGVAAVNAVGTGPVTTIQVSVPDGPPPATVPLAPAAGKAKAGKPGGQKTLVFVWKPPTSDGGSAVLGYQVRVLRLNRSGGVASRFSSQEFSSGTRKVVITTRAGRYAVQVRARNAVGWSTYSVRSNVVRAQ